MLKKKKSLKKLPKIVKDIIKDSTYDKFKLFFQDETRVGLHTTRRRRITYRGVKPKGIDQNEYSNFYIYGAISPFTGENFFYDFNVLDGVCFEAFLREFSKEYPHTLNIIVLDNASAHTTSKIKIPENVKLVFQPPYTPEVNPVESLWQYIKDKIAWNIFKDLEILRTKVYDILNSLEELTVMSISLYPYITGVELDI